MSKKPTKKPVKKLDKKTKAKSPKKEYFGVSWEELIEPLTGYPKEYFTRHARTREVSERILKVSVEEAIEHHRGNIDYGSLNDREDSLAAIAECKKFLRAYIKEHEKYETCVFDMSMYKTMLTLEDQSFFYWIGKVYQNVWL